MGKKATSSLLQVIWVLGVLLMGLVTLLGLAVPAGADSGEPKLRVLKEHRQRGSREFQIVTVSTRNDTTSGGDVLVRIDVSPRVRLEQVVVTLNGQDVTGAFRPVPGIRSLLGLVTGLRPGDNTLIVREEEGGGGRRLARLMLTNWPITGPIFSGPHEQPFICTTDSFNLPVTGGTLGPPLDENCSIETRVDYIYRSTESRFERLPDPTVRPDDLAYTTTNDGVRVPYIVRVETGTTNRAIYQTAILHDPLTEATPDPWTRPAGWNGKLIYTHGGGCRAGWYFQGNNTGGVLDAHMLGQGYATASASLNVFGNNCNDLLASETTMMVKERFIERYGVPRFTIGWGSSGGSYQSHQTGDNYPGILDGILIGHTFPDVTSATIFKLADSRLLEHYFNDTSPGLFSQAQQLAVSGFGQFANIALMSDNAKRIDPDAEFAAAVPVEVRYDPVTNPGGARATVYDHTVNAYGRDRETGFALRPLDNEGVQYGLGVCAAEKIEQNISHIEDRNRARTYFFARKASTVRPVHPTFYDGLLEKPFCRADS